MKITKVVVESHRLLDEAKIRHAIGGAIALSYHGRPRSTMDVDINLFATVDRADEVYGIFSTIGFHPDIGDETRLPVAGVPLVQDEGAATIDLFFALDDSYEGFVDRSVVVPFGSDGTTIPIVCADDLVVFKLSFGRPRDWIDLDDLAARPPRLDLDAIEGRLVAMRGPMMYPRLSRFAAMLAAHRLAQ